MIIFARDDYLWDNSSPGVFVLSPAALPLQKRGSESAFSTHTSEYYLP
jgi:hypothetical protein